MANTMTGEIEMGMTDKQFKSYLRKTMRILKDLKDAIEQNDNEKAERIINEYIEDTQKDIED